MSTPTGVSPYKVEVSPAQASLELGCWNWAVPVVLFLLTLPMGETIRAFFITYLIFPLAMIGMPISGIVGLRRGFKGARVSSRRLAMWGIALNAAALIVGVGALVYYVNWWYGL